MTTHTRRSFLAGATVASILKGQKTRPPNIVYIMADDLGYGDLGCYGQTKIQTPNIDRLASQGIRFTDTYAGCTVCAPSRSVLMTGRHMGHTSVRSNPGGVPLLSTDVTVAEVLKSAGYATGGFGKWGLGDKGTDGAPWKKGFDQFFGYLNQVHAHYYYPQFLYDNERRYPLKGNESGQRTTYSHDVIAEKALEFIQRQGSNPFFCYMPLTTPHLELLVPNDSLKQYSRKFEEKPYIDARKHYADQPESHAAYAGMVSRMDRDVGRVLSLLKESGLEKNTIVFFSSDNGGATKLWSDNFFQSTGQLRGHKQNLYEGGIRVPMIARWPGKIRSGVTSDFPWAFWDILPTFAALAGAKASAEVDGQSIVPTLLGRKQKPHEFLYWEFPRYNNKTGEFAQEIPMQAVRMGDWKAVRPAPNDELELYNLKTDIGENHNVAKENPKIIERITTHMKTARTEPRPQKDPPQDFARSI